MEICPIEEHSINIIQLCCVVCGLQETTKQKFVEICFSGAEYNLQTFKNIEVDKTFSKVIIQIVLFKQNNNLNNWKIFNYHLYV